MTNLTDPVFLEGFTIKKQDTLKIVLDNESWIEAKVGSYYQGLVNILNSLELAEEEYVQLEDYNEQNQVAEEHPFFLANE